MFDNLAEILFKVIIWTNPLTYIFIFFDNTYNEIDRRTKEFEEFSYYNKSNKYLEYLKNDLEADGIISECDEYVEDDDDWTY